MKYKLTLLLLIFTIEISIAQPMNNIETSSVTASDIFNEYLRLEERYKEYSSFFTGLYDIVEIQEILIEVKTRLDLAKNTLKNDHSQSQLNSKLEEIRDRMNSIELVYSSFQSFHQNQNLMSEEYFDLWNEVYKQKTRIDRLYTKVNVSSSSYAGLNEQEFKEIKYRGIYYPCQKLYDYYLIQVRNTNQCDFQTRISYLVKAQKLLYKQEELSMLDNKRDVEKQLNKLKDNDVLVIEKFLEIK